MKSSKRLVQSALSTLKENVARTGDPLGFCKDYWSSWADGKGMPQNGETIVLTSRMYQMLPYVLSATRAVSSAKPLLPLLRIATFDRVMLLANRLAGESMLRWGARRYSEVKTRAGKSLQGIVKALQDTGRRPGFLYNNEPYSGALLCDLGLEDSLKEHIGKAYEKLVTAGCKEIITVDPHTTHMLKKIYPQYIKNYELSVHHYMECLVQDSNRLHPVKPLPLSECVIHDSCVMTRDLGIIEPPRIILKQLGLHVVEAENNRLNTACCGGPVEYAFSELSEQISRIRIRELAPLSHNIVVTCPICLINFMKYEKEFGVRVWDIGELLFEALGA